MPLESVCPVLVSKTMHHFLLSDALTFSHVTDTATSALIFKFETLRTSHTLAIKFATDFALFVTVFTLNSGTVGA